MSETKRFRLTLWAVLFFVLATALPGWYMHLRLLQKISRLEQRIAVLEAAAESPESAAR